MMQGSYDKATYLKRSRRPLAPLGSGQRFQSLEAKLAAKGAEHPAALAAYIGRKKYGAHHFARLGAQARNRSH